jgi:hypothetical protein
MLTTKKIAAGLAAGLLLAAPIVALAAPPAVNGSFSFDPIAGSAAGNGSDFDADAPWIIPDGFSQSIVSDETDLDIYLDPTDDGNSNDWNDMNTVNETGQQAGRYLYRTHEVRDNDERGGVVSVVDLQTGEAKVIAEDPSYDALDGIEWTPWGTILFAEEVTDGRLFEIVLDKKDPTTAAAVIDRPEVGRMAHEGIAVGSDGSVYVVDEFRGELEGFGGGIYKFVPDKYGDLSSGDLYALKVTGPDALVHGIGQGEWVGPIDPADARQSGTDFGGTGWNRPEDLQIIGNTLYAAITEGPRAGGAAELYDGKVIAIDLTSLVVSDFVKPGMNVPVESSGVTGFDNPDNLAKAPNGDLIIVEDNIPSDIWFATKDGNKDGYADVVHFASLTDNCAEGTGIYFGKDPKMLFVNVQHSCVDDGDATWVITKD